MASIRKYSIYFLLILAALILVLFYRAYVVHQSCRHDITRINNHTRLKLSSDMIQRLQTGLRYPTVSYKRGTENLTAKIDYVNFIRDEFKELETYSFVKFDLINNLSMLYELEGKNKELKPYLIAAHFDVVPAEKEQWKFDPFSAELDEGFINARGTMDNKASMISQLEAAKLFLKVSNHFYKKILKIYNWIKYPFFPQLGTEEIFRF